jgi:hypothetical protein
LVRRHSGSDRKAIRRLWDVAGFEVASDSEIAIEHRFSVTPISVREVLTQRIPGTANFSFLLIRLEMRRNDLGNTRASPRLVFASWYKRATLI